MHKILKIVLAVFSLVGIVSLFRIISTGEEGVKALGAEGDTSLLEPMFWIAYLVLAITIISVVVFVIINLITNGSNLKATLIGFGSFVVILLGAYLLSGGDTNEYFYNSILATDGESQLVGGGLVAFYVLSFLAVVSMLVGGVKKIIN